MLKCIAVICKDPTLRHQSITDQQWQELLDALSLTVDELENLKMAYSMKLTDLTADKVQQRAEGLSGPTEKDFDWETFLTTVLKHANAM